jgi:hypothetical protein
VLDAKRQRRSANQANLTEAESAFVDVWQEHIQLAQNQREEVHRQILAVHPGEVIMVVDFKENLRLPFSRNAVGQDFYTQSPVTLLSFVTFSIDSTGTTKKHVFTVLSLCLTHTAKFVIECLKVVLKQPLFSKIHKLRWWSDEGPHFRNQELLGAFYESEVLFSKKIDIQVNLFEAHHGKSVCDTVFGQYATLLKHHAPESGIHTYTQLFQFLTRMTQPLSTPGEMKAAQHTFLEYAFHLFYTLFLPLLILFSVQPRVELNTVDQSYRYLKVQGFRSYLSFSITDGMVIAREKTGEDGNSGTPITVTWARRAVKSEPKKSDADQDKRASFDDELSKHVQSLRAKYKRQNPKSSSSALPPHV